MLVLVVVIMVLHVSICRADFTDGIYAFSGAEKTALESRHNYFRGKVVPKAGNMEQLEWNDQLSADVGNWLTQCKWKHSSNRGSNGQNLWIGEKSKYFPDKPDILKPIESWYNESKWYNIDNVECVTPTSAQTCGHFKQVVYAKTKQVGCALAFCGTTERYDSNGNQVDDSHDNWLLGCNYDLGVYVGVPPYITDTVRCGMCPAHARKCLDGLCATEAQCNEATASTCECKLNHCGVNQMNEATCECTCCQPGYRQNVCTKCKDKGPCSGWPQSHCTNYAAVRDKCPFKCNTCGPTCG